MSTTDQPYSPRGRVMAVWVLRAMLSVIFVVAGCAKVIGTTGMVQVFEQVGFGQWFRMLTGVVEVVGGLLLLVPALSAGAAAILAVTMFGATVAHLTVLPPPTGPALALLALCLGLAWLSRLSR